MSERDRVKGVPNYETTENSARLVQQMTTAK